MVPSISATGWSSTEGGEIFSMSPTPTPLSRAISSSPAGKFPKKQPSELDPTIQLSPEGPSAPSLLPDGMA
jgi:hypothetical protein